MTVTRLNGALDLAFNCGTKQWVPLCSVKSQTTFKDMESSERIQLVFKLGSLGTAQARYGNSLVSPIPPEILSAMDCFCFLLAQKGRVQ